MSKKRDSEKTRRSFFGNAASCGQSVCSARFPLYYEGDLTGLYGGGRHSSRPVQIPRPAAYFVADLR